MNRDRLTIGSLQIYFEGDRAGYKDYKIPDRALPSVEGELAEWQEFVERWLALAEPPPIPRKLTQEEQTFSTALKKTAKRWQSFKLSKEAVVEILRLCKAAHVGLTEEQANTIIEDVASTL